MTCISKGSESALAHDGISATAALLFSDEHPGDPPEGDLMEPGVRIEGPVLGSQTVDGNYLAATTPAMRTQTRVPDIGMRASSDRSPRPFSSWKDEMPIDVTYMD